MANLISLVTGNHSAAGSWGVADTTMAKTNGTTSANVTTSNLETASYTPGVITVDGILLNMSLRVASPSGTMTVTLRNQTAGTDVASVTINNSDLPAIGTTAQSPGCWIFFKFSGSQLLLAATAYRVRVTSSVNNQCALYGGASNDWNILLRTTTTAAPGAADRLFIQGEKTGTGAMTSITITNDNNAATDFGAIDISDGGTLIDRTTGSTQLRLSGMLYVWKGGTLTQSDSNNSQTHILEFDSSTDVEFGLYVHSGTWNGQGASKTKTWSKLAADASAGATALTLSDNVGTTWKNGDTILITTSTRTAGQSETKTLGADSSGTSLPTVGALANDHGGDAATGVQCEVANLNRNIVIRAVASTLTTYVFIGAGATVDLDWVELYYLGSATTNKRGFDITTTAAGGGDVNIQNCAIHDCNDTTSNLGFVITGSLATGFTISNNVVYNVGGTGISIATTSATAYEVSNNLFAVNASGAMVSLSDLGGTISGNIAVSGTTTGFTFADSNAWGTVSNNEAHGNTSYGVSLGASNPSSAITMTGFKTWRNSDYGFYFSANVTGVGPYTLEDFIIFGNANAGLACAGVYIQAPVVLSDCVFNAGATLTQPVGIDFIANSTIPDVTLNSCSFGATTTHATADIRLGNNTMQGINTYNTTMASATEVSGNTTMSLSSFVRSSRHDGTAGAYKAWFRYGTIINDTVTFNTASPSEQLTANNASFKLESAYKYVAMNSGQVATVSVYIRKNAGYTGNQPRLIVKRNDSAGITADTVLATYSAGTGSWNQISGATAAVTEDCVLTFCVDCDTGGSYINIDDYTVSLA